jgi:hypothetical protein
MARARWTMVTALAVLLLAANLPLSAYYPFLHWREVDGRRQAIPERFDLQRLPGGVVPVVTSRGAEPQLAEGDHWDGVSSQVRLALKKWSAVPNATLRLADAGEAPASMDSQTPHIQLLLDELPPGVIGMAGPVAVGDVKQDEHGHFVPIRKSMVILNADLRERPSYGEAFFLTLMHELGHAVGLQHTFTSSVMSTGVTRSTTKADPLAVDDFAGVAVLYPDKYFAQDTGVIRGRITLQGEPLHFAAVTALLLSGQAVSTLTFPDGSYEIRGLPAGRYYLYAQAVPPSSQDGLGPGQIVLPRDEQGRSLLPGPTFATRFFPGVEDWRQAFQVEVQPGLAVNGIDLDVPARGASAFRGVTTYSFPNGFAVNPAVVQASDPERFLVAFASGLTDGERMMEGLTVEAIGARVPTGGSFPYPWAPAFLQVNIAVSPFTVSGPKTLVWKRGDDVYVQPAAFLLVGNQAPSVREVHTELLADPQSAGESPVSDSLDAMRLRGDELGGVHSYLLDGLEATAIAGDGAAAKRQESLLRTPHTTDARLVPLVALSRDGQSSLFVSEKPALAPSRLAATGAVRVQPENLPAGAEVLVKVEATEALFAGVHVHASFGKPGVLVRKIWRVNASTLWMNVATDERETPGPVRLTLWNDLARNPEAATLHVVAAGGAALPNGWRFLNRDTGGPMLYPGAPGSVFLPASAVSGGVPQGLALWLDETMIPLRCAETPDCQFEIPNDIAPGVKAMTLRADGYATLPIGLELPQRPARILEAAVFRRELPQGLLDGIVGRFELVAALPGAGQAKDIYESLKIRANGQTVSSFQVLPLDEPAGSSASDDRRFRLNFEVRLPRSAEKDGQFRIQLEYQGTPSPVVSVSASR